MDHPVIIRCFIDGLLRYEFEEDIVNSPEAVFVFAREHREELGEPHVHCFEVEDTLAPVEHRFLRWGTDLRRLVDPIRVNFPAPLEKFNGQILRDNHHGKSKNVD